MQESIKEIQAKLGISRARVYQIIDSLPLDKKPKKDNKTRKYILTPDVVQSIYNYYSKTSVKSSQPTVNNNLKDEIVRLNQEISSQQAIIDKLKAKIEDQDKQILDLKTQREQWRKSYDEEKQERIELSNKYPKALDQQQQLNARQLQTQNETNENYKQTLAQLSSLAESLKELAQSSKEKPKHSIFGFLKGKDEN